MPPTGALSTRSAGARYALGFAASLTNSMRHSSALRSGPSRWLRAVSRALAMLALPALGAALAPSAAQTTWTVNLNASSFSPSVLNIQVGDTVQWNWVTGIHNVVSGTAVGAVGTHDGNFYGELNLNPGINFSVVFDEAFLAANPMPNFRYPYYCDVHLPGMKAEVRVSVPPAVQSYGCTNPTGSLTVLSGQPKVGTSFSLGVRNPLGTQGAGSLALAVLSLASDTAYPCGLGISGWGMSGPGASGELLVSLLPGQLLSPTYGPVIWGGGPAAALPVNVPNLSFLIGLRLYAQGALFDPVASGGVQIGLTDALSLRIGQ